MMRYGGGRLATYAEEQKKRGRKTDVRTMRRVMQAFHPYRFQVALVLTAILLTSVLGLIPLLLVTRVFDDAIQKGNATRLLIYVAIMMSIPILVGIIGVGQNYLNNKVGQNVMRDFRNQLYHHLQSMPLHFFTKTRTGEIQSRLANDVGGVQGIVTTTATSLVSNSSIMLSAIIAMALLSPLLTVISLGLLPLFVWITHKVGKTRRQTSKQTQKSFANLTALMQETLSVSGILLVKVLGQQPYAEELFQQENQKLADLTLRQLLIGRWLFMFTSIFFSIMPSLIYLIAGEQIIHHLHILGSDMTLGTVVAFTTLQFRFFSPVGQLLSLQLDIQGALALFDRIFEYLDLPVDITDKLDALQLKAEEIRGELTFRNVTFTYKRDGARTLASPNEKDKQETGGEASSSPVLNIAHFNREIYSNNAKSIFSVSPVRPAPIRAVKLVPMGVSPAVQKEPRPALKNISFTIKPGQLAALVGPSGAGKTTITYLVPRLYDVEGGAVEVDGINVKDIAQASLGKLIGVVTQENYLFHTTVRNNLLYAHLDATEAEMIAAAKAAAIHDRILELEKGYDTIVGERGYKLSGGEKQRLAIARVLLKDPRILILDEATSALDSRSERLVQAALERLMKGRTTLAIAHRLSTILAADVILVVNKGEIVERGTHQELLALGGLYAQLYHEQFLHKSGAEIETSNGAPVSDTTPIFETQTPYLQAWEAVLKKTACKI